MSRKLIIPKGVVDDATQNNIIEIPAYLSNTKGNLIARRQGNKIVAQQLPDWEDDLSSSVQESSNIVASPAGCAQVNNRTFVSEPPSAPGSTTYYSAGSENSSNYLSIPTMATFATTCYDKPIKQTPSRSQIRITGNDLTVQANVESNIQMSDAMTANVLADNRRALNTTQDVDNSYLGFDPPLSSTQKSLELSSMYDSAEESDYFFMGAPLSRSQEGKYNIISPMTPSPPRLAAALNTTRVGRSCLNRNAQQAAERPMGDTSTQGPAAQVPDTTFTVGRPQINQTFLRPVAPRALGATFNKGQQPDINDATFTIPKPQMNQTFTRPATQRALSTKFKQPRKPCTTDATFTAKRPHINQTFAKPAAQRSLGTTFSQTPQQGATDSTFTTGRPQLNQTFAPPTMQRALDTTFNQAPTNQTFARPALQRSADRSIENNCPCEADETYSGFDPLQSSTQRSFELPSMYDSSEESEYFFMGAPVSRSQDGKYNIISPMTPSPPKPGTTNSNRSASGRTNISGGAADDCACEHDGGNMESIVSYQSDVTEDVYTE